MSELVTQSPFLHVLHQEIDIAGVICRPETFYQMRMPAELMDFVLLHETADFALLDFYFINPFQAIKKTRFLMICYKNCCIV